MLLARHVLLILICAACCGAQTLPNYLRAQYPAANATGVPTNTRVTLSLSDPVNWAGYSFTLKTKSGAAITTQTDYFFADLAITPIPAFAPSTQYVVTVTPVIGTTYTFSFTTGSGPDTTAPHLIGFDPPSGTGGLGVQGPVTALFDKPLLATTVDRGAGLTATGPGGLVYQNSQQVGAYVTTDGKGMVITLEPGQSFPAGFAVTIDPTKLTDIFGNPGVGAAQTAHYSTFVATDTKGPSLLATFPSDGNQGLPVNTTINLLFDRAVDTTTLANAITLTSASGNIKTGFTTFASGRGVTLTLSNLLAANQTFQCSLGAGIRDLAGISFAQPSSFQFTTGANPDPESPGIISLSPPYNLATIPLNAVISLRGTKPFNPIALAEFTQLTGPQNPAVTASFSADGKTLTLTPTAPLAPNTQYSANLSDLTDITGASFHAGTTSFTTGSGLLTQAPAVVAVNPADGAQNVGAFPRIRILFSAPIGTPVGDNSIRLSLAGVTVPSRVAWDATYTAVSISPNNPLALNTTYTIEVNGVTDLAGNVGSASATSFTTGSVESPSNAVNLLSSSPASGDTGVDVNATITLNFNQPLSAFSAVSSATVQDSAGNIYPISESASGTALTIVPAHALLQNARISVILAVTDASGEVYSGTLTFRTGSNPDNSPFQVSAVDPPDGSTVAGHTRNITLTFNKPVDAATIAGGNLAAYSNGSLVGLNTMRTNSDSSLVITPQNFIQGDLTISAGSITDLAGNSLIPFSAVFHYLAPANSTLSSVVSLRPANGSRDVSPTSPITLYLSVPVNLSDVNASLVVVANGAPVGGQYTLSPDGLVLTFQPAAAYPSGAKVQFYQRTPVFTDTYGMSFTVAIPPAQITLLRYTPTSSGPANSVMEFEFSSEVDASKNLVQLYQTQGQYSVLPGNVVATTASHPRARVIRLTPKQPLAAGAYVFVVDPSVKTPGGYQPNQLPFTASAPATAASPTGTYGPQANSTGAPLNASIGAAFTNVVNPLSVTSANITVQSGGQSLVPVFSITSDGHGVVATPSLPLPAGAEIDVAFTGVTDLYGNPIPDRSWSFTAGSTADYTQANVVAESLSNPSYLGTLPQLQPNEPIRITFSKPINPASIPATIQQNQANWDLRLSDDLYTLSIIPNPALPKGIQLYLPAISPTDLAGNSVQNLNNMQFAVAFDPDTKAPNLLQASPYDGQTGLPLNTEIMASFDKTLAPDSFLNITVMQGDKAVPLIAFLSDANRVRLAPVRPLLANTTYTVAFQGLTDISGNVMNGTVIRTFTTGASLDTVAPTLQISATGAPNVPMTVHFSKPVSAATVDSQTIILWVASNDSNAAWSWVPVAASVVLSPDGMTATITPAAPLKINWPYQITLRFIRDFAGNSISAYNLPSATFTTTTKSDTTAPAIYLYPPDGSTNVPVNSVLGFVSSKSVPAQTLSFQMTANGQPVSGTLIPPSNGITPGGIVRFVPDTPLVPNTTYRIDVSSITDLSGNVSDPVYSTFTTYSGAGTSPPRLKLLSTSPASGDAGVALNAPLTLNFNGPAEPYSVTTATGIFLPIPVAGVYSFQGNSATFTPSDPWPSATQIQVTFNQRSSILDMTGVPISPAPSAISFRTVASMDTTRPQLLSASPPEGTLLTPPYQTFSLTFSKTVSAGSGGLLGISGTQSNALSANYSTSDYHTLLIDPSLPASGTFTISGTQAVVDSAGNPLVPFTLQYPTGPSQGSARPSVTKTTPYFSASGVDPSTPIVVQLNESVDPQSLMQSVRVTANGANITGTLTISNSNSTVQFTPSVPYPAGARIDIFVLETLADLSGLTAGSRYNSYFTVATAGSLQPHVTQTSFGNSVAPEASLELAFDRPLDPALTNSSNFWLRMGHREVAGTVTPIGERNVRFTPLTPMQDETEYVFTVGRGVGEPREFSFRAQQRGRGVTADSAEITSVGGMPALHVHFSDATNPLAADNAILITADGTAIAVTRRISPDFRDLWLLPVDAHTDLSTAKLSLERIEDRSGRRVSPWAGHIERKIP